MGRLPTHYAGKRIIDRQPYVMFTDVIIGSAVGTNPIPSVPYQFPDADLAFDVDKPFEIHRLIPWAQYLVYTGDTFAPTYDVLALLDTAEVGIRHGANIEMVKGGVVMSSLVRGSARQTWEWEDPYYVARGENLHVAITATPPSLSEDDQVATRYMLALVGNLVTVEG